MDWSELRQRFIDWSGRIVRFTNFASAKSDGTGMLIGRAVPGRPGRAPQTATRLIAPFGFRSVPPPNLDAMELRANGCVRGSATVPCDTKQYGPDDVAEDGSEFVLYNTKNKRAIAGTGQDVVVNEGTLAIARETDPTGSGAISVALHTVSGLPTTFFFYTPQGSTPTVTFGTNVAPVPTPPTVLWFAATIMVPLIPPDTLVTMSLPGKITGGAPHFKGQ